MTPNGILQIIVYFAIILMLAKPMGVYMATAFEGRRTLPASDSPASEVLTYKLTGVDETAEQRWTQYAFALIAFSAFSFLFVYFLQRLQGLLPFNPQGFGAPNVPSGSGIQYGCQFRHEHELASVQRRVYLKLLR